MPKTKLSLIFFTLSILLFTVINEHNVGSSVVTIKGSTEAPRWDSIARTFHQCKCALFDPKENSTVLYRIHGRLGNHMMGYAMMLGLKRVLGYRSYLEQKVHATLDYYFDGETLGRVPSKDWMCEDHPSYPWETTSKGPKHLAREDVRVGSAIEIHEDLTLLGNSMIKGLKWDIVLDPVVEELKKAFVFKKRFRDKAQETLRTIAEDYREKYRKKMEMKKKKAKKEIDIVFVGIHLRKTGESEAYIVDLYGLPRLLASYYLEAIELYRAKYKHAVFLLISDNMEWGEKNILPRIGSASVYPVGNGQIKDMESVGVDFATLVSCNHTILSYGSFSFWAGFLSGGKRVIPAMIFNRGMNRSNPLDYTVLPPFAMTDHGARSVFDAVPTADSEA